MAYLDDHPQRYPQQRHRLAWGWAGPSGLVGVHVAVVKLGTPRANVNGYIVTRGDAGSYHVTADPWGFDQLVRDEMMAWHIAEADLNGPSWGVSGAATPDDCRISNPDVRAMVRNMAVATCQFWRRQGIDPESAARWLSRSEVLLAGGRIVGLIHHGVVQPRDRYDAWVLLSGGAPHPDRHELDALLVAEILAHHRGGAGTPPPITQPEPEETNPLMADELSTETKTTIQRIVDEAIDRHYVANRGHQVVQLNSDLWLIIDGGIAGLGRRHIRGHNNELAMLRQTGIASYRPWVDITPDTEVAFLELPVVDPDGE